MARKVDVIAYDLITYPPLKAHIDGVMVPLFDSSDLRRGAPGVADTSGT